MRKTGEKLQICYDYLLMESRKLIESEKVGNQFRLELVLDQKDEVFSILVISLLGETETELEPVVMKDDEEEARKVFQAVIGLSFLATSPSLMRVMANNKVLKEVFNIDSAVTVIPMDEITKTD